MSRLSCLLLCSAAVLVGSRLPQAYADGLIYRLPPDGAWVRYQLSEEADFVISLPPGVKAPPGLENSPRLPVKVSGLLMLCSVGRVDLQGEACRWIELRFDAELVGKMPDPATGELREKKDKRRIILKMLIPEKHLAAGSDPLAHVRKLYFKDGDAKPELIEDEKDKQYQLDRFRPVFPAPAAKRVTVPKQPIDTPNPELGRMECEKHTFDSSYEGPLTRGRRGWWSWQGKHEVWLNDKVPFGVVSLKWTGKSDEWSGDKQQSTKATAESTKRIIVSAVGSGAESEVPSMK
jgi:hypothetical protein